MYIQNGHLYTCLKEFTSPFPFPHFTSPPPPPPLPLSPTDVSPRSNAGGPDGSLSPQVAPPLPPGIDAQHGAQHGSELEPVDEKSPLAPEQVRKQGDFENDYTPIDSIDDIYTDTEDNNFDNEEELPRANPPQPGTTSDARYSHLPHSVNPQHDNNLETDAEMLPLIPEEITNGGENDVHTPTDGDDDDGDVYITGDNLGGGDGLYGT